MEVGVRIFNTSIGCLFRDRAWALLHKVWSIRTILYQTGIHTKQQRSNSQAYTPSLPPCTLVSTPFLYYPTPKVKAAITYRAGLQNSSHTDPRGPVKEEDTRSIGASTKTFYFTGFKQLLPSFTLYYFIFPGEIDPVAFEPAKSKLYRQIMSPGTMRVFLYCAPLWVRGSFS